MAISNECQHSVASGYAGRSPIRFASGRVNPRAVTGAARSTYYDSEPLEYIKPAAIRRFFPNNTKTFL